MKIAILGTRGVPASYGGFETMAQELGTRLVQRGHEVTVYCRSQPGTLSPASFRGIHLRTMPTIRRKHLETIVHTAVSVGDAIPRRFDVVLMCNVANAPLALAARLGGAKVALNVDGLEWERAKWGRVGRSYYRACAWLAASLPVALVSDAAHIARWYAEHHGRPTTYIPYGSDGVIQPPGPMLHTLGLDADGYILYVSRFEPENHADTVIRAYARAGGVAALHMPLVLVGDAPYAPAYRRVVDDLASATPGVVLTGYVFGDGYAELQSNAAIYVQATEVGGTHPALVEAMSRARCVVANDVPEHREVLGPAGRYYRRNDVDSLAEQMAGLTKDPAARMALGADAANRAADRFSWDAVANDYESLFLKLLGRRPGDDRSSQLHPGTT